MWAALAWLVCGGLATQPTSVTAPTSDAWLEAKPACVFPLDSSALPANADLLSVALAGGLSRLAVTPTQPNRVQAESAGYPALSRLRIDLSNSIEDNDHKPPKVNWHFMPQSAVSAEQFIVSARPLIIKGAKIEYELTAARAILDLAQDRQNRPMLMLTGTPHGHLDAMVSHDDVESLCLSAARHFAAKYHFWVKSLRLNLSSPTDRTLEAGVDVALGGSLYGNLHFTGRFKVADDLTTTPSDLTCRGDGPGGILIEGMVLPGLMYYNGKTKPLLLFPFDRLRLTDLR